LFAKTDMRLQGETVMAMLSDIVQSLDNADWLVRNLAALGQRHVGYGVVDSQYDLVRDSLLHAMGEVMGDEFTAETRAAWSETYALAAALMQRGGHARSGGGT
jgi:hemoglobin-like flavoprotein